MADNYSGVYASKRISELAEAANVSAEDMLVVNQFNGQTGFSITKKASAKAFGDYIDSQFIKPALSANLGELASESIPSLLDALMTQNRLTGVVYPGRASLAISSVSDLGLGELAYKNASDLGLSRFIERTGKQRSFNAKAGEYITGMRQTDGTIDYVQTAKFADAVPVDGSLDRDSVHAVSNRAVAVELDGKVSKASASASFSAPVGKYVAGVVQRDGKIESVEYRSLPGQIAVDQTASAASSNPVSSSAVAALVAQLQARIDALETIVAKLPDEYLRVDSSQTQTVYGPVKFVKTVQGNMQSADVAKKSYWS